MKATGKKIVFKNSSGYFHLVFPHPLAGRKKKKALVTLVRRKCFSNASTVLLTTRKKNVVERELQILFPFIQLILRFWILIWHQLHQK